MLAKSDKKPVSEQTVGDLWSCPLKLRLANVSQIKNPILFQNYSGRYRVDSFNPIKAPQQQVYN